MHYEIPEKMAGHGYQSLFISTYLVGNETYETEHRQNLLPPGLFKLYIHCVQ